jgi:hypothetical protein
MVALLLCCEAYCDTLNSKKRKIVLLNTSGVVTAGSLVYLHQAWYKNYNTGKFHFFNDNDEWMQMDKAGHAFTTYQTGRLMMEAFDWAGFNKKQKLWSGTLGFGYMSAIEVMDGFSRGWGFSWGDKAANLIGTGLAIGQEALWSDQRIGIKFSYSESGIAKYNPGLLGENFATRILKDYNGQTYWLTINPISFVKSDSKFPNWINLAFGYSAYGMLGGSYNHFTVQTNDGTVLRFDRERRFYFSLDLDLKKIPCKNKTLKGILSALNMIKIPFPTLQFSKNGIRGYAFYF